MKKTIFLTWILILILGGSIFASSDGIVEMRKQYRAPTANLSLELKKGSDTYNGEWVKNNVNVVVTKPSGLENMTDVYYKKAGEASYTAPVGAVYTSSTITLVFNETINTQMTFVGVDVNGNQVTLPTSAYTIKIDKTIPQITSVDKTATGTTVNLKISVEDLQSEVKSYAVSTSTVASNWVTLGSTITNGSFNVEVGGEKTVYLWLQDSVGNVSAMEEVVIYKDITPPTGTIEIVGNKVDGVTYVNSTSVKLKLTASDNSTATADIKMKVINEEDFDNLVSTDDIEWETFKTEVNDWPLTSIDGKKVVYLLLKDAMGNVSVTIYGDSVNYTVHHFIKDVDELGYSLDRTTTEKTLIGKHIILANEQLILKGMTYEKVALSFDGTPVAETVVAEDGSTEVYVHYKRNKYNVTLNNGDGTYGQMTVTYGGTYEGLPELTRPGYTFGGWINEEGVIVNSTTEVKTTKDEELIANWFANDYTVTLDPNGGSVDPTSITVTYDALYQTLPEPTKSGYDFLGWYNAVGELITKDTEVKITADETLTAQWEVARFTVTLDPNGGEVEPTTIRLLPNGTYEGLPTPTKEGHTFIGWYTALNAGTKVESTTTVISNAAHTLYARWSVNTYTITFDTDGGTAVPSITQEYGTDVIISTYPTKQGWQFGGWTPKLPETMPAENITLKAMWIIEQFQITFDTDGGTAIEPILQAYGAAITAPENPTKTGYTFAGWDKTIPTTMPAEDMTITAKWTANTYGVVYNGNGNTGGSTSNTSHTYDVEGQLAANGFEKTGHIFVEWNTKIDGSGTGYNGGQLVTNLTTENRTTVVLYAIWQVRTYTVRFDANGGNIEETGGTETYRTVTYGKTFGEGSDTVPTAIRDGYIFVEWNTAQDGTGTVITDDTVVTEMPQGMYVYAQWNLYESVQATVLYENGVYHELLEGFNATTAYYNSDSASTDKAGYNSTSENYIWLSTTSSDEGAACMPIHSTKLLDVTDIDYIEVTTQTLGNEGVTNWAWMSGTPAFGLATSKSYYKPDAASVKLDTLGTSATTFYGGWKSTSLTNTKLTTNSSTITGDITTYTLDTSTLTGTYYLQFTLCSCDGWDGQLNIYKIAAYKEGPATYEVTFNANGGTINGATTDVKTVTDGLAYGELPIAIRDEYEFLGWNTKQDGSGTTITDATVVDATAEGLTVYAQWKSKKIGIDTISLSYRDAVINGTVIPNIIISPSNYDEYQSIKYSVSSGGTYVSVNQNTGLVTANASVGSAVIEVTIVDATGKTVTASANVKVIDPPMLAADNTYLEPGWSTIEYPWQVTYYELRDSGAPSSYDISWDGSANKDGSIMVYAKVDTTPPSTYTNSSYSPYEVYVVGNGSGAILANPSSIGVFGAFTHVDKINGLELLNTSKVTEGSRMFYNLARLTTLDVSTIDTRNMTRMIEMFCATQKLPSLDVSNFDTSNVTDMRGMFESCAATSLDLSNFDTRLVTDMSSMFRSCSYLTDLNISSFNTSQVTSMASMFGYCSKLNSIDVSHFDTKNVQEMNGMFFNCKLLSEIDVSGFDTSNLTTIQQMFQGCASVEKLEVGHFDTSRAESFYYLFDGCVKVEELAVENWNTDSLTSLLGTFSNCSALKELDLSKWNTANVTTMTQLFYKCSELTTLDVSNFVTNNVTRMDNMFDGCSKVKELDVSNFYTGAVTNMASMFSGCSSVTSLDVSHFRTGNATRIDGMFQNMSGISTINVSNFDLHSCLNVSEVFYGCSKLTTIDISAWNTTTVTNATYIFGRCTSLNNIIGLNKLANISITKQGMFCGCTAFKTLDISTFEFEDDYLDTFYTFSEFGDPNGSIVYVKNQAIKTMLESVGENAGPAPASCSFVVK